MKENQLLTQSLEFATQIIKLQKYLISEKKETNTYVNFSKLDVFNLSASHVCGFSFLYSYYTP